MPLKTDSSLETEANVIKNETAADANTASRIGTMLLNLIRNKSNKIYGYTASGTDSYSLTVDSSITSYTYGQWYIVKFTNANTGAATIDINGIGVLPLKKGVTTDLIAGDIGAGSTKLLSYDGTNLIVVSGANSAIPNISWGDIIGDIMDQADLIEALSAKQDAGSYLESVTGDGVDNTDPANPVISFQDSYDYTDDSIAQEVIDRNNAIVSALEGLKWKDAVKVATTTLGVLATSFENGDTIDGVVLVTGDRILIKDQVTQSENGIYIVALTGAPTRSGDANSAAELEGATVPVQQGSSNANTSWTQTTDGITLGSSNIVFTQIGTSVPDATSSTKGIAKLYTALGTNTDGAIDQNTAKTNFDLKIDKAGDTMSGNLAMGSNKVTGLAAASGNGEAVRYEQITGFESTSSKDATGGYVGLTLFKINFKNVLNTFTSFFTNSNTASRTYTFQDRNGTIADDTDLALKLDTTADEFELNQISTFQYLTQ